VVVSGNVGQEVVVRVESGRGIFVGYRLRADQGCFVSEYYYERSPCRKLRAAGQQTISLGTF
jgi:hypothetical protein